MFHKKKLIKGIKNTAPRALNGLFLCKYMLKVYEKGTKKPLNNMLNKKNV